MFTPKHHFGAYLDGGYWSIIHWAGKGTDVEELKRHSEVEVSWMFPAPFDHKKDPKLKRLLEESYNGIEKVGEEYLDCDGAYIVSVVDKEIRCRQLLSCRDLREAAGDGFTEARLVFVFCIEGKLKTLGFDLFFPPDFEGVASEISTTNENGKWLSAPNRVGMWWLRSSKMDAYPEIVNITSIEPTVLARQDSWLVDVNTKIGEWLFIPFPE